MTDSNQNQDGSGAQGSDDATKDERDYVVTENEDESEKARLAQEAAEADADDQDEDDDDSDDDEDGDDEDQSDDEDSGKRRKRKRGGFQKKISRLEEEKEYWRRKALETSEKTPQKQDQKPKAEDAPPKKPNPKDFETYDEYSEALTDWKVDEKLRKAEETRQTEAKRTQFKEAQQTKVERYEEGIAEAQKAYDDFDEVIEDYDGPLTIGMQQALLDSDMGPQVAYHIAKNPKLGEKMAGMTILQLNKEVAKIEARLEKSEKGKGEGTVAKKTSKSPPPIDPVKGSSKSKKSPDDMSYEEYLKEREQRRRSF